jgi:hypothetical protein
MTTALRQLATLAARLSVTDRQLRIDGRTVVAIAGLHGVAKSADSGERVHIVLTSHRADESARRALMLARVLARLHGTNVFEMRRTPNGATEREAFRALLGLARERERAL